jgi:hypothetical protein
MATINDAVIDVPRSGECTIDMDKACLLYDKYTFITKYISATSKKVEYRLVRSKSGKGNFKGMRITISEKDALFLINKFKLTEIESPIFRSESTFKRDDYCFFNK